MVQVESAIIGSNGEVYIPCRRILGEGSLYEIALARDQSGTLFTLKIIKQLHPKYNILSEKLQKEASTLVGLNHHNIVKAKTIGFGTTWNGQVRPVSCLFAA